jgi:hypothetical protein
VTKLKLATHKYGEMMESYKVKEELENWLAKLGELKVHTPHTPHTPHTHTRTHTRTHAHTRLHHTTLM